MHIYFSTASHVYTVGLLYPQGLVPQSTVDA